VRRVRVTPLLRESDSPVTGEGRVSRMSANARTWKDWPSAAKQERSVAEPNSPARRKSIDCRSGLSGLGRRTEPQSAFAKVRCIFADLKVLFRALWIPKEEAGGASCELKNNTSKLIAFEVSSKRRKGFPSETHVKRGDRVVGGSKELLEKLGRNDPCLCGSGRRF
jgi:hypothetical protein